VEEYASDRLKSEILSFWSRHPYDKFTTSVISCALGFSKLEVSRALKALADNGLIDSCVLGDLTLYNLTTDETKRMPVLELSARGWDICRPEIKRQRKKKAGGISSKTRR
jgi:DNA-binding transcriptional ArsR family regulator